MGALAARTNDASVQHAWQPHVLHVDVAAAHLLGNVVARRRPADQPILARRLHRCRAADGEVELPAANQVAVGDGPLRFAGDRDDAARDRQLLDRSTEALRRELQQRTARLGRRAADLRRPAIDRRARIRAALIGRDSGVERDGVQLAQIEIELLSRHLQQRRRRPLPELGEADVDRRGIVGVNRQPGVDLFEVERSSGGSGFRPTDGRCLTEQRVAEREADDERAAGLDEVAAGAHALSFIVVAARAIAFTTRG
jgi:hypothetical protein